MKTKIGMVAAVLFMCVCVFAQESRPQWISEQLKYGRETYEKKSVTDETKWAYMIGISTKHSSERRARNRAEQDVQERLSATVAAVLTKNIDQTAFSEFAESETEDALVRFEEALNISITVKVPSIEFLEYYVEKETEGGKPSYTAYVFARYLVTELREFVEKIDVEQTVQKAEKAMEKKYGEKLPEELNGIIQASLEESKASYVEELSLIEDAATEVEDGSAE